MTLKACLTLIALWMVAGSAFGGAIHPLQDIAEHAENFAARWFEGMAESVSVKAKSLDSRLRLHKCTQKLQSFKPAGAQRNRLTTVGIRCNGGKPWTLYVPIKVSIRTGVWVTSHSMKRGQQIDTQDVIKQQQNVNPRTYQQLPRGPVVGKTLKTAVAAGRMLNDTMLAEPILIRRGQQITITIVANGLEISAAGVALENGIKGKTIRVRNRSSKRIVSGVVSEDGKVVVRI